jgi:hypothetical protein
MILAAFDHATPIALAVAWLPQNELALAPHVYLAFAEPGHHPASLELGKRVKQWALSHGHTRMTAVAMTHSAKAWEKGFRELGRYRELGTLVECSWAENSKN